MAIKLPRTARCSLLEADRRRWFSRRTSQHPIRGTAAFAAVGGEPTAADVGPFVVALRLARYRPTLSPPFQLDCRPDGPATWRAARRCERRVLHAGQGSRFRRWNDGDVILAFERLHRSCYGESAILAHGPHDSRKEVWRVRDSRKTVRVGHWARERQGGRRRRPIVAWQTVGVASLVASTSVWAAQSPSTPDPGSARPVARTSVGEDGTAGTTARRQDHDQDAVASPSQVGPADVTGALTIGEGAARPAVDAGTVQPSSAVSVRCHQ